MWKVFKTETPRPKRPPIFANGSLNWEGLKLKQFIYGDKVMWVILAILAIISVLLVFSSTAKMAYDITESNSTWWYLTMQIGFLVGSMALLLLLHRWGPNFYGDFSWWILWLCIGLTALTYVSGSSTNGAARWLNLGFVQIQPSEALKVALALYLAKILSIKQPQIKRLQLLPNIFPLKDLFKPKNMKVINEGFFPILFPIFVSVGVIVFAHTSSAILVFIVSMIVLGVAGIKRKEIFRIIIFCAVLGAIFSIAGMGRSGTAGGRFTTWAETWTQDRSEIRIDDISDTERAMVAIHNGGLFGQGAGQSMMRVEMIHPESDYAFSFFVEEYGLILSLLLLLLYLWVFFRAMWIYERSRDPFQQLLVISMAILILTQALLHIMVSVNYLPETGQNLPLVSRGGSAMFCTYMAFMLMLSVSTKNDEAAEVKTSTGGRRG